MMRADYYRKNRAANYWRAITIKRMRSAGVSYREIAEHYLISPERARQICRYHRTTLQLNIPLEKSL